MPTLIADTLTEVRAFLLDQRVKQFWTDPELTAIYTNGVKDLWGAILDLHGEHFMTVDVTNVSLAANGTQLTGVPADCFRVLLIAPRDTTPTGAYRNVVFTPKKYTSDAFKAALAQSAVDPGSAQEIFYHVSGAGAPTAAPVIYTAPTVSTAVLLRFVYCPTVVIATTNPIPGESDNALKAWTIAYAMAKEGPQGARMPDPGWLSIYATEKQLILTRSTPRQEQAPDVVEDFFNG